MKIIQSPSPNFSPSNYTKIGVEIHKTLGHMPGTLEWLRNPISWSSAHFLITRSLDVHQMVQLKDRSWSSGRINQPSARALRIMIKTRWGSWVKPGHYLVQIEFECLENETFSDGMYGLAVDLFREFPFDVTDDNFLEHQDTAIDKPDLERERSEILRLLGGSHDECDSKPLILENWNQLSIKVDDGKIIFSKKI